MKYNISYFGNFTLCPWITKVQPAPRTLAELDDLVIFAANFA